MLKQQNAESYSQNSLFSVAGQPTVKFLGVALGAPGRTHMHLDIHLPRKEIIMDQSDAKLLRDRQLSPVMLHYLDSLKDGIIRHHHHQTARLQKFVQATQHPPSQQLAPGAAPSKES